MYMRACICMNAYSTDFLSNEKSEMDGTGKFIHHACNNRKIIFSEMRN